jgi:hypothetical protein
VGGGQLQGSSRSHAEGAGPAESAAETAGQAIEHSQGHARRATPRPNTQASAFAIWPMV